MLLKQRSFYPKNLSNPKGKFIFSNQFFFDFLPNKNISYTYPKSNWFSKRKNYLYLPEKKQTILWINEINSYTCPNKLSFRKKKKFLHFSKKQFKLFYVSIFCLYHQKDSARKIPFWLLCILGEAKRKPEEASRYFLSFFIYIKLPRVPLNKCIL